MKLVISCLANIKNSGNRMCFVVSIIKGDIVNIRTRQSTKAVILCRRRGYNFVFIPSTWTERDKHNVSVFDKWVWVKNDFLL